MDKETKKTSVGILSVFGGILFAFSIYIYIDDPHRWHLALALNVAFLVIGAVLITLAIVIQKIKITETKQTPS
jgi:hypothetical protein